MLENLSSELKGATPATVAAALALLSPDELQLLRDALDLLGPPKSGTVTYHISMVDGSEIEMTLSNEATVSDACLAIADQKGVRASQVNLLAAGQSQPMSKSDGQLCSATDGSTELFAILSATYDFGQPKGPLAPFCSSVTFEHFPVSAYLGDDSMHSLALEPCDGQEVSWPKSDGGTFVKPSVIFSDYPLSGKILLRFLIHRKTWALGLGVALTDMHLQTDPEYSEHFFGLYHGGHSTNVCMQARRTYRSAAHEWHSGTRLAILLDLEEHNMQCYDGLQPFGPKQQLPSEDLAPVISLFRQGDSIAFSVSYV
ncbi:Pentatricopeptide repeat-containing protein [Durusdinium trenchii]|uniref:Mitochondrial n=1 Tax=Durusdinium trenchii TaxID=1381693 RepID=A0ABP0MLH1_9DINO